MKITDEELRAAHGDGLRPAQIAERWGLAPSVVYRRLKRLGLATTAALHGPAEAKRFATGALDVMEQIRLNLARVDKLFDACDAWLTDPADPDRYDVGPRSDEVIVIYTEGEAQRKATLQELLDRASGAAVVQRAESKIADPRDLVLRTAGEARQIIGQVADLSKMLADSQRIQDFQDALMEAIAGVDPETAHQIADAVRRQLILRGVLETCLPAAYSPASSPSASE